MRTDIVLVFSTRYSYIVVIMDVSSTPTGKARREKCLRGRNQDLVAAREDIFP